MSAIAWGDESVRVLAPQPTYLLAAAILPDNCSLLAIQAVKPKGAAKLHWRELTDKKKQESLTAVASLGASHIIVAAAPLPSRNQERARRKCLEVILPELESKGIDTFVLESRTLKMDAKDIALFRALRSKRQIDKINIRHLQSRDEPRLWVADQVLGAYGDRICGMRSTALWEGAWKTVLESTLIKQLSI